MTPLWIQAAAREIAHALYDTGDVDSLEPDEAYWVRFIALHVLQAAEGKA